MTSAVTLPSLLAMKRAGQKIVGIVAWDYQMARIADGAGVEIVSVGDTVGINLWGRANPLDMSMDEMVLTCQAVRRGVQHALLSCDFPFGPLQEGPRAAVRAAIRLVRDAGADMVKLDGAADFPECVAAIHRAGIPVFAQFGLTPQTMLRHGIDYTSAAAVSGAMPDDVRQGLVADARRLEEAGAALLDFTNSGPVAGAAACREVSVPVLGGLGGGPWLDGRMRMAHALIGYAASMLDQPAETYANTARTSLAAISAYAADVRAARQIAGGIQAQEPS